MTILLSYRKEQVQRQKQCDEIYENKNSQSFIYLESNEIRNVQRWD